VEKVKGGRRQGGGLEGYGLMCGGVGRAEEGVWVEYRRRGS